MSKFGKLSKEELLALVEKQDKELASKKYGLVWDSEREPEQVVLDCENNLPVLKRVKGKEIKTNDNEDNILIEGDNYHALSVLNYTHQEKIDVIYIDPPYNTGNKDFIYNDRYVDREDGYRHSKWLNFMEKRLNLAKELLKETGVIFISIDDNEQANLKLLCDKIFGEENFIDAIIWKKTENIKMDSKFLSQNKDYILCYRKSLELIKFTKEKSTIDRFKLKDEKGRYYLRKLDSLSSSYSKGMDYIIEYNGIKYYPGGSREKYKQRQLENPGKKAPTWLWSKKKFQDGLKNNEIVFKNGNIYNKVRYDGIAKKPFINIQKLDSQQTAQKELDSIFGKRIFDHPKPLQLVGWLIRLIKNNKSATILDFMAGSGTTGHAVLDLNKVDGGNRKFILCSNNENNNGSGKIMDDVCYPRIEKVINGYKNLKGEKVEGLGGNIQYFKTFFVKKTKNKDQVKINLTKKCTEMLCVKENIFNFGKEGQDYKIFYSNKKDKFLCVYYNFLDNSFNTFLKEVKKLKGKKIIYIFSVDNKVDKSLFSDVDNFTIEPIPKNILDIYEKLVKINIK